MSPIPVTRPCATCSLRCCSSAGSRSSGSAMPPRAATAARRCESLRLCRTACARSRPDCWTTGKRIETRRTLPMLDFTSALYLGMRHAHETLRPWAQLTTGRPAALEPAAGGRERGARLWPGCWRCERAALATFDASPFLGFVRCPGEGSHRRSMSMREFIRSLVGASSGRRQKASRPPLSARMIRLRWKQSCIGIAG